MLKLMKDATNTKVYSVSLNLRIIVGLKRGEKKPITKSAQCKSTKAREEVALEERRGKREAKTVPAGVGRGEGISEAHDPLIRQGDTAFY